MPRPWELAIPTAIFLSGHDMILSDELVYNCIRQVIAEHGTTYAPMSNSLIVKKTGLGHATVERALKRLLKAERIFWEATRWSNQHNRRHVSRYRLLSPLPGIVDEGE